MAYYNGRYAVPTKPQVQAQSYVSESRYQEDKSLLTENLRAVYKMVTEQQCKVADLDVRDCIARDRLDDLEGLRSKIDVLELEIYELKNAPKAGKKRRKVTIIYH